MTRVVTDRAGLDAAVAELGDAPALVPTMGALHAGHAALIRAARASGRPVVVSVFVNPMQFNQSADLERYPRPIEADVELCASLGVDIVLNPGVEVVYPDGPLQVWVTAGAIADQLEGPNRPGHFDGVLSVVTKLLVMVRPGVAYFGEKDYQQLTLVRRLVRDLGLDVEIVGVATVREPDGLALSSRNVFLSPTERDRALALIRSLRAGRRAAEEAGDASEVLRAARAELGDVMDGPDSAVEYLALRDPDLGPAPLAGEARLLVAARFSSTRLIDNLAVHLRASTSGASS